MTATWPSDVPQDALLPAGYGERPQRNVASFQPDSGIAIERRRSSVSTDDISYTSVLMTSFAWDSLVDFYRDTLKDGVLPFLRTHPRTGDMITAKFTEAPAIVAVFGSRYRASIRLIRLP